MIDSNVRVFSKVDVDNASVGKKMYGFNRYLSTKWSDSFVKGLCSDWQNRVLKLRGVLTVHRSNYPSGCSLRAVSLSIFEWEPKRRLHHSVSTKWKKWRVNLEVEWRKETGITVTVSIQIWHQLSPSCCVGWLGTYMSEYTTWIWIYSASEEIDAFLHYAKIMVSTQNGHAGRLAVLTMWVRRQRWG